MYVFTAPRVKLYKSGNTKKKNKALLLIRKY